ESKLMSNLGSKSEGKLEVRNSGKLGSSKIGDKPAFCCSDALLKLIPAEGFIRDVFCSTFDNRAFSQMTANARPQMQMAVLSLLVDIVTSAEEIECRNADDNQSPDYVKGAYLGLFH